MIGGRIHSHAREPCSAGAMDIGEVEEWRGRI